MTALSISLPGASMTTTVPKTPLSAVEATVKKFYGLKTKATGLSSERDELFRLMADDGSFYILRFSNPGENQLTANFQTNALQWLETTDPALPVPRILQSLTGESSLRCAVGDAPVRTIRLMSYLEGKPLPETVCSVEQRRSIGDILARIDRAMIGFSDPDADHVLAWDIRQAAKLRAFLPANIMGNSKWVLVQRGLDYFERHVEPRQADLRSQVVHGDLNPHNILVDPDKPEEISGILDFGDMVKTPLINDVAIAAAYQVGGSNPLEGVADVLQAFHKILPLTLAEIDLLFDLIVTRLCIAVTITEWRARCYPENRSYILKNTASSWLGLQRLDEINRSEAIQFLRRVCNME